MEDDEKDVNEDMILNIELRGEDNSIVKFKIRRDTLMQKIFLFYCNRKNLSRTGLKFMINDKIVNGIDTAQTLMLKNGDCINVHKQVCYIQHQSDYVNLYVHCDGHEVASIKILHTAQMEKLFDIYSTHRNIAKDELGYMFNGYEIHGTDTPKSLRLRNGNIVDVFEKSIDKKLDVLTINMDDFSDKYPITKFKVKLDTPMLMMFKAFCTHRNVLMQDFRFFSYGRRVHGQDTARSLELEDGDKIEVFQEITYR